MRKKLTILGIIIFILTIMSNLFWNNVKGKTLSPELYFGIKELRDTTKMGYSIGDPKSNSTGGGPSSKIWKMEQYSDSNGNGPREADVYCVKANAGFTSSTEEGLKLETYNLEFDMYTERDEIANEDKNTRSDN